MPLQKQNLNVPFMGLDQKSDPFKVAPGNFLSLVNTVPLKGGQGGMLLQKRNGFQTLGALPNSTYKYINTFKNNLIAIGSGGLASYSSSSESWISKGVINPIQLSTLSLVKNSSNQTQVDTAIAGNGLVCVVFTSTSPSTVRQYAIYDSSNGQNIVAPTTIASASESARVFLLSNYFIVLYSQGANLKYVSIPINNTSSPSAATTLVTNYSAGGTNLAFDGVIFNNNLYVVYNGTDGGGAVRATYMNSFLVRQTAATGTTVGTGIVTNGAIALCVDTARSVFYSISYNSSIPRIYGLAFAPDLTQLLSPTTIKDITASNITCTAISGSVTVFYEATNTYSYGTSLPSNFIGKIAMTLAGSVGSSSNILRSVGLASKAFRLSGTVYMLASYSSPYQPSFFLIDSSGNVVGKLAYSNGGGYLTLGLPSATITDSVVQIGYLVKDLIVPANKEQNPASPTPVFAQTGVSLVSFDFTTDGINSSEIGSNLNVSGSLMWTYDGTQVVEQGFNVWPDNVIVTTATGAGSITAQDYYYVAVYEWTDNQGNIHRSAPSIAVKQTTTTASSTNTIKVPTLRLTYKTLVKIVLYRWSTAQQTYYQVTSISSPTLNDTTVDNVSIADALADSSIVGNSILYTTGGVIEDIAAPATSVMTLFKSRLFLVDAEDRNLLWYSKQVIESTPVEMSDLFTVYVAPTISAQGDTGPITAISAMDDKLIIFKKNAIYYLVGNGPDNRGANNDFSDPVFITSTIGCDDQNSIVFTPNGLQFQSDKGIWLLGRDLSTVYIGSPVENFNESGVLSSLAVPGTNQVRFALSSGEKLMYDYFFNVWGTFEGVSSISDCLYQGLHTFIDSSGRVFQEDPGSYLDGSRPVLMSFQTGWFNLVGLQGYERAYFLYLLGTYISPHKLTVQIAYDYSPSASQSVVITPDNFNESWGGDPLWGSSSPWGGSAQREQWRVFFAQQKCEAFQLSITESFDSSFGTTAGAGLTLSGINLVIGGKKAYRPTSAANSIG